MQSAVPPAPVDVRRPERGGERALPAPARLDLVGAAKAAFVHGSNVANVVAALVAVAGAVLAMRYLPRMSRPVEPRGARERFEVEAPGVTIPVTTQPERIPVEAGTSLPTA